MFKIDELNHIETPLLDQIDGLCWGIIARMQNLLTGKKRVTALLNETEEIAS